MTGDELPEEVIQIVRAMALNLARRTGREFDDLNQCGLIAALQGWRKFDPAKNDNRQAFLLVYIRGGLLDCLRKLRTGGLTHVGRELANHIVRRPLDMDSSIAGQLLDEGDAALVAQHDWDDWVRNCPWLQVSERTAQMLRWYFWEGLGYTEIAQRLGCSRWHANREMLKILAALKARAEAAGDAPA